MEQPALTRPIIRTGSRLKHVNTGLALRDVLTLTTSPHHQWVVFEVKGGVWGGDFQTPSSARQDGN